MLDDFLGYAQLYTLDCESRSAVDWAAYLGYSINEQGFLDSLPKTDNPETGFVGDYTGPNGNIPPLSYGVHAAPVAAPDPAHWSQISAANDEYRRVRVSGLFLDALSTKVQAVTDLGSGFWLMTPLRSADGSITLINRGYIPAGAAAEVSAAPGRHHQRQWSAAHERAGRRLSAAQRCRRQSLVLARCGCHCRRARIATGGAILHRCRRQCAGGLATTRKYVIRRVV